MYVRLKALPPQMPRLEQQVDQYRTRDPFLTFIKGILWNAASFVPHQINQYKLVTVLFTDPYFSL
jgi:hypothetical protein